MSEGADLQLSIVRRLVKQKLVELQSAGEKRELGVQKEALSALSEAAKIFIHYVTHTANEVCHAAKRQTISAEDVLKALEECEFAEFLEPLQEALAGVGVCCSCTARAGENSSRLLLRHLKRAAILHATRSFESCES